MPEKDKTDDAILSASDKINQSKESNNTNQDDFKLFREFVVKAGAFVQIDNKMYLTAEAWQYIIALKGLNIEITCEEDNSSDKDADVVIRVTCKLVDKEGRVVSIGVTEATTGEDWLKDKSTYAVYGTAQTRAISRAVRNKFAYIAKVSGFEAVPYDEMSKGKK